ncbi:hypothetical protein DL96DRAFT_1592891 [Flagelloscypha sp. PMI_526]|nr:hypothetical protein DL96DRAFT_1592891 [Flagelloscypha sp. PMI_526]
MSTSPRKGDTRSLSSSTTKRVFFCGVVVEGAENGRRLPDDIQDLILSFGGPLESSAKASSASPPTQSAVGLDRPGTPKQSNSDPSSLAARILELVKTEKSYVSRIKTLKHSYADPLRQFAKDKSTALLAKYDARVIFGNIDALVPVNAAFLKDLELMQSPDGLATVGGIGDVALKHFKELNGFEEYKTFYGQREDAQKIFLREKSRKNSPFMEYIERVKYEACDEAGNRVGLEELLIEPVQRIPRYTMLFRIIIDLMAPDDPQRQKLIEAEQLASKIALADPGEVTKRALIFRCLTSTIEGFPADLCSSSRRFIDCIDVEDVISDSGPSGGGSSSSLSNNILHCSLFLFDDKLVFVKRPNGEKSGRVLAGLDTIDKLSKSGILPPTKKKSGMAFRGVLDITEVVAADVGNSDIHIYLENPPRDQGDRWSGRPFRSLSVVSPPLPAGLNPVQTEADKSRFLENLWYAQATYRASSGLSVVRCAPETEVDSRPGRIIQARTYFNIYQRTAFLQEPKKTKVVVHVNTTGADQIPFGLGGPPYAVIQVIPMDGELSRFKVTSADEDDEDEDDIVRTERIPSRIIQTIHQFGFFEFKAGSTSRPSTPTSRNKSAKFGLDVISRRLNARPGSTMGDFFGGSVNSHRRTKSTASRSSMYTSTTGTGDSSLMRFSHRSNSTAATTISSMGGDDDTGSDLPYLNKSTSSRNVLRRGKSPGPTETDTLRASSVKSQGALTARSRSRSKERNGDDLEKMDYTRMAEMNGSEWDLNMKLELARKNSQNQHSTPAPMAIDPPSEPTIYEEDTPLVSSRPPSRGFGTSHRKPVPVPDEEDVPTRPTTPVSRTSSPVRRPLGPRSPSPQPPLAPAPTLEDLTRRPTSAFGARSMPSGLPRSKRVPLFPTGNTEGVVKAASITSVATNHTGTEPLTIKKKTPSPTKEPVPLPTVSLKRAGTKTWTKPSSGISVVEDTITYKSNGETRSRLIHLALSTKEDVESAHRAVKRLKVELESHVSSSSSSTSRDIDMPSRSPSPDKMFRTGLRSVPPPVTKEAQARMDEMRNLINRRADMGHKRSNTDILGTPTRSSGSSSTASLLPAGFVGQFTAIERDLANVIKNQALLADGIEHVTSDFSNQTKDLEMTKIELSNSKRQCELVKDLLADVTAEKDIMYEAFNEELDGMYNDVNLPDDDAWERMTSDLRKTKEARNAATKQNSDLKQKIAELEMQQDLWGALLRSHGLIP